MIAYTNHYFSISRVYTIVGQLNMSTCQVILVITCGSHQLLSNESVHFSNDTGEVHSDPRNLDMLVVKLLCHLRTCLARLVSKQY